MSDTYLHKTVKSQQLTKLQRALSTTLLGSYNRQVIKQERASMGR